MTKYGTFFYSVGSGYGHSNVVLHNKHDTAEGMRMALLLHDALPHGSGIDYTWRICQLASKPTRYHCFNSYHAMDEYGGYCHVYDFKTVIDVLPDSRLDLQDLGFFGQRELACCGYGIHEYLWEDVYQVLDIYNNTTEYVKALKEN